MLNNIERLIKQRIPFQSETVKALVGFMYVSYILQDAQQQYFKPFGITLQQYNILRILRGQFPKASNINLIKERMIEIPKSVEKEEAEEEEEDLGEFDLKEDDEELGDFDEEL